MLFFGVYELEWVGIMCMILWSDVVYVNSAISIICFTCSSFFIIYECENSFPVCVCV